MIPGEMGHAQLRLGGPIYAHYTVAVGSTKYEGTFFSNRVPALVLENTIALHFATRFYAGVFASVERIDVGSPFSSGASD